MDICMYKKERKKERRKEMFLIFYLKVNNGYGQLKEVTHISFYVAYNL